jgi:hypothetical protein
VPPPAPSNTAILSYQIAPVVRRYYEQNATQLHAFPNERRGAKGGGERSWRGGGGGRRAARLEADGTGVAEQDAGEGGRSLAAGTAPGTCGGGRRSSIRWREMGRWPVESELGASRLHGRPASFDRAASMAALRAPTGLPPWLTARPR